MMRIVALLVLSLLIAACTAAPTPTPVTRQQLPLATAAPAKPSPSYVTAGAFCSVAGATGVTSTGKPMVCKTTDSDSRLRWRSQ